MAGSSMVVKAAEMVKSGREAEQRRTDYVCVLVLVDTTAPASLAIPVRDALDPRLPSAEVRVVGVGRGGSLIPPVAPDVCVAVLGSDGPGIARGVREVAEAGVPVAIVAESVLDIPPLALGSEAAGRVTMLSATSAEVLTDRLAEWLVDASEKGVAMAANFPFCRRAKVRELINEYALANASGVAKMGPSADLPSMAVNQARLALSIAAVNGQPLALGRIPEVLSAVGAGFGSRVIANKALGKLPFVGWFFKVGFGYFGTQATGMSLQHRFDKRERAELEHDDPTHEEHPTVAQRMAQAVRSRVRRREGTRVSANGVTEVRLLPGSGDDDSGFLVYEPEEVS